MGGSLELDYSEEPRNTALQHCSGLCVLILAFSENTASQSLSTQLNTRPALVIKHCREIKMSWREWEDLINVGYNLEEKGISSAESVAVGREVYPASAYPTCTGLGVATNVGSA